VRFVGSAVGAQVFGPVPGNAIAQDTQRFGQFWSPILEGDVATIEFHAGTRRLRLDTLTLTLPRIAHRMAGNGELRSLSAKTVTRNRAGAELQHRRRVRRSHRGAVQRQAGVAQLLFVNDDGGEYLCTGTLLNTVPTTNTPYLYTAGTLHEVGEGRAYAQHAVVLRRGPMPKRAVPHTSVDRRRRAASAVARIMTGRSCG
jgi:hypothetical protein